MAVNTKSMIVIGTGSILLQIRKDQKGIAMNFKVESTQQIWIHKDPGFERTHKFQFVRILSLQRLTNVEGS